MSSKQWTLLYSLAKLTNAAETAAYHFSHSATSTIPASLQVALNAFRSNSLTKMVCMSDDAMSPTLSNACANRESDRLLMRCMPKTYGRRPLIGDIVAFKPPSGVEKEVLVRRIAAIEGEEMVSDDPQDEAFKLPAVGADHYWVLADNEGLKPKQAEDSRTFGPLHVNNILGRIIYYVRSHTEHGPVENSKLKSRTDRAILEAELDVEEMLATKC